MLTLTVLDHNDILYSQLGLSASIPLKVKTSHWVTTSSQHAIIALNHQYKALYG